MSTTPGELGVLAQTLHESLAVVAESSQANPWVRHEHFRQLTQPADRSPLQTPKVLAVRDGQLISFSAYQLARQQGHTAPAHVARNSRGMHWIANLDKVPYEDFVKAFGRKIMGLPYIEGRLLRLATGPDRAVFGPELSIDIRERLAKQRPNRGCPARGMVLRAYYERYVDVIFATQLADEAAAMPLRSTILQSPAAQISI